MRCIFGPPDEKILSRLCYHGMQFCWAIDDALPGFLGWPFCMVGDFLEDLGLERGYIRLSDEVIEVIKQHQQQQEEE